jgi:hypothetical protein
VRADDERLPADLEVAVGQVDLYLIFDVCGKFGGKFFLGTGIVVESSLSLEQ